MKSKKPIRTRQLPSRTAKASDAWKTPAREPQDKQAVAGVGRAGAPLRKRGSKGLSRTSEAQIRDSGVSSARTSRPGRSRETIPKSRQGKKKAA